MGTPQPGATLSGTVYADITEQRIAGAIIKATPEKGPPRTALSDDDGDFTIDNLPPGKWGLVVMHESSGSSRLAPLDLPPSKEGIKLFLPGSRDTIDNPAGKIFFIIMCLALVALVVGYVLLHVAYSQSRAPLSTSLTTLVAQAQEQAQDAQTPEGMLALTTTVTEISNTLRIVIAGNPPGLGAVESQELVDLTGRVQESIKADKKAEMVAQLESLKRLVQTPPAPSFFWSQGPWRFAEILLWGLGGILAHLILTSGTYLRRSRFYREGIYQHVALLGAMPVVALVIVMVLSLVMLKVTLPGSSEVTLDLTDPGVLAPISFLIGFRPFVSWRLVNDAADRVLQQTRRQTDNSPATSS